VLLLAGIVPFAFGRSGASAQARPALIVDDAATANTKLCEPPGGISTGVLAAPVGR
jgi:hypothetical protein